MNMDLEIRKLPLKERTFLIHCLEDQDSWKKLMAIIPQSLQQNNYNCDITDTNPAKYRSGHFYIIQNASKRDNILCTEILLREWGTSGRVRPTLGHLKYLLEKAQLFNAAEFTAVDVLKQAPPARPTKGPAAPICFDELDDSEIQGVEELLDEMDYSSALIEKKRHNKDASKEIPKIEISESFDFDVPQLSFNIPFVVKSYEDNSHSDLLKFSESDKRSSGPNVPNFSLLISSTTSSVPVVKKSNFGDCLKSSPTDNDIPVLSAFGIASSDSSLNVPEKFDLLESKSRSFT